MCDRVFESGSFTVAMREFLLTQRDCGILRAIHRSKDPTTFTVLFEDSAALVGLLVALGAIYLEPRRTEELLRREHPEIKHPFMEPEPSNAASCRTPASHSR